MADAPFCNISPQVEPANPQRPIGLKAIPPNATLPQVIRILNYNFGLVGPQPAAGQQGTPGAQGGQGKPGKPAKNSNEGNWKQTNIVKQKVRVFQVNTDGSINRDNFVDVERINKLTMTDQVTGATWVYTRQGVDGPNIQLLQS